VHGANHTGSGPAPPRDGGEQIPTKILVFVCGFPTKHQEKTNRFGKSPPESRPARHLPFAHGSETANTSHSKHTRKGVSV
jgi:hypothetical protein